MLNQSVGRVEREVVGLTGDLQLCLQNGCLPMQLPAWVRDGLINETSCVGAQPHLAN